MSDRIRLGVVGCGLIAQVMHLPYLNELSDRYEVAALCDLSEPVARECARRYGVPSTYTRWTDLLEHDLDAVMILTSGDHAPIGIEAARAGIHVFTEKPMALSQRDGIAMVEAARASGVRLMVGTMKRYDPAYQRLVELASGLEDLRLVRVTTLEAPLAPFVSHYPLVSGPAPDPAVLAELEAADERALDAAVGDADEQTRAAYRWNLLDTLIHEINALRGVLGEPDQITSAELSQQCVSINMRFGETDCHLSWVDLPGIARYHQELAFYTPSQRLTLRFASPFLRSAPTELIVEGGELDGSDNWSRREMVSYEEAFKRELVEFADCIATGREPLTSGSDGLGDLRVCEAIVRAYRGAGAPATLDGPTAIGARS